jgi:hypothetical protein
VFKPLSEKLLGNRIVTQLKHHNSDYLVFKKEDVPRHWWLMPLIQAIWEAEIGKIKVRGQPEANS